MGIMDNSPTGLQAALATIKANLTGAAQIANSVNTTTLTPTQMQAIHAAVAASGLLYEAVHRLIE